MTPRTIGAALLALLAIPVVVGAATAERQKQALETVAAVLAGRQDPRAAEPYFAKQAVFVGPARQPWDIEKFGASLDAGGCSRRGKFWEQERVLSGLAPGYAAELRRKGHPEGPGLSFYCASPKIRAGHSMITFKFDGEKISQVRQAYYVPVPAYSPPPAPARSN